MKRLGMGCFGAAWLLVGSALSALEPPTEIRHGLAAEEYPQRIRARAALRAWADEAGEASRPWLIETSTTAKDPELRGGAEEVLRELVVEELTRRRPGFVGIMMRSVELEDGLGDGFGVQVQSVEPGSPADLAGLKAGDVILRLAGKGWSDIQANHRFANRVAEFRVGDRIRLEIMRSSEQREIEVELAARPWENGTYDPLRRSSEPLPTAAQAKDQAFRQWLDEQLRP